MQVILTKSSDYININAHKLIKGLDKKSLKFLVVKLQLSKLVESYKV